MNAAKQANLIANITQRVRDAHAETKRALEAWTSQAAESIGPNDPALEALRGEWQRARDAYVAMLESYFLVASGALSDVDDLETRLTATGAVLQLLRSPS